MITPALSVEMLRHRLVGRTLARWEADLIFPLWPAVWQKWHSEWKELTSSDTGTPDLGTRRRRISTASTAYESPTMVGDDPDDYVACHVDFFGRSEAVRGCGFDGNCILVCGTSFDWADVFMLAVAFSVQTVCGMDGSCGRRSAVDIAGSLLLVAGLSEKLVVPVLIAGLQDPLTKVALVTAPECWSFLWATVEAEVASTGWLAIAEWPSRGTQAWPCSSWRVPQFLQFPHLRLWSTTPPGSFERDRVSPPCAVHRRSLQCSLSSRR